MMNIVFDIIRHSRKSFFETAYLRYLTLNQDVEQYSKIWWRGNGGSYMGEVNIGDIQANEWREIMSYTDKSDVGLALYPNKRIHK